MIVLRQVKGSELTWDEVDNNFVELQTTASNGLTKTIGNITLGGTYIGNIIVGDDSDYTTGTLAMYSNGNVDLYSKLNGANYGALNLRTNSGFVLSSTIGTQIFSIGNQIVGGIPRLAIVNKNSGVAHKGIYYDADYSGNWIDGTDDNVLVNKKFVDNGFVKLSPASRQEGFITIDETSTGGPVPAGTKSTLDIGAEGFIYFQHQDTIPGFKNRAVSIRANFTGTGISDQNNDNGSAVTVGVTSASIRAQNFADANKKKEIILDISQPMRVTDEIDQIGLGDAADYSANKTAYSYVTKQMLDAIGSLTNGSGVYIKDGKINAGIDTTTIGTTYDGLVQDALLYFTDGVTGGVGDNDHTSFQMLNNYLQLYKISGGALQSIEFSNIGASDGLIRVNDSVSLRGLGDAADYSNTKQDLDYITLSHAQKIAGNARIFLTSGDSNLLITQDVCVFDGSVPSTFTLPDDVGNSGKTYSFKNTGTATLSITISGTKQIFDTSLVSSISLAPGANCHLTMIGTQYWIKY